MKTIKDLKTEELYQVSNIDSYRIEEFQKPVKNWDKLDKLLMTGGKNGHCLISNDSLYFDWSKFVGDYPEFKKDIDRLFVVNRLNPVMEVSMLNSEGKLVTREVLFNIKNYKVM